MTVGLVQYFIIIRLKKENKQNLHKIYQILIGSLTCLNFFAHGVILTRIK